MFAKPLARAISAVVAWRLPFRLRLPSVVPTDIIGPGKKPGFIFKPKDPTKVKQNADGTGAVTPGDPVGYVEDTTGNGNHAVQTDPAQRGTYTADGYITFDTGQSLEVTFSPINSATEGWAYLDGSSVTSSDLSSGTLVINDDFYGLVVTDDTLTAAEQQAVTDWLDSQITTSVFQAASRLRAVFIPD